MSSTLTVIPTSNTEFPLDSEGRVYHVGAKRGEIANRVLLVGDPVRAELIATTWLSGSSKPIFSRTSTRGFTWYTGLYKGTPVTVMAIGMGISMMDFAIREIRALVDGLLVVIRLGTAGSPNPKCHPGTVVVSSEAVRVEQNLSAFDYKTIKDPQPNTPEEALESFKKFYTVSPPAPADKNLTDSLASHIEKFVPARKGIQVGVSASAESFYSSQGRVDKNFFDNSTGVVDGLLGVHPDLLCIEMETHQLFHLGCISALPTICAGCAFILMQRREHNILDHDTKVLLEKEIGQAILETLVDTQIAADQLTTGSECVWN